MRTLKLLLMLIVVAAGAMAQRAIPLDPENDVKVAFRKGAVVVTVPEGAHLKKGFMEVTLKSKSGTLKVGPLPQATEVDELNEPIWHGAVRIPLLGEGLSGTVVLEVQYQPCTEGDGGVCYPPTSQVIRVQAAEIPGVKVASVAADGAVVGKAEAPAAEAKNEVPKTITAMPATPVAPKHDGLALALDRKSTCLNSSH